MKTLLLVITLVSLTGCRGMFWSEELKRKATDYAVGQKYELLQDIEVANNGLAKRVTRRTDEGYPVPQVVGASIVPKGTRLKITKLKFVSSFELGRLIENEAVIITGKMTGTKFLLRSISKDTHPRAFFSSLFVDDEVMKRVD